MRDIEVRCVISWSNVSFHLSALLSMHPCSKAWSSHAKILICCKKIFLGIFSVGLITSFCALYFSFLAQFITSRFSASLLSGFQFSSHSISICRRHWDESKYKKNTLVLLHIPFNIHDFQMNQPSAHDPFESLLPRRVAPFQSSEGQAPRRAANPGEQTRGNVSTGAEGREREPATVR